MFFINVHLSIEQAALNYVNYCDNLLLTIGQLLLWIQLPLLIKNLNWTIWFYMIDSVTHVTQRKVVHLTQTCWLIWPGFNTGEDSSVCTTQAIGSSTDCIELCRSKLTCTTATHPPEVPSKHFISTVVRIYKYCSSKWQLFLLAL